MRKNLNFESTIRGLGMITIFRIIESWLEHYDDEKLWHLQSGSLLYFWWIENHHKRAKAVV